MGGPHAQTMASGAAAGILLAILLTGVGLLAFAAVALGQRWHLRRHSRVDGGPLEPGVLLVRGRASATAPDETVRSPVTGGSALLYEYAVQRRVGSTQTPDWQTVSGGQNGVAFRLETGAGAVLVVPAGAGLELPETDEVEFVADPDELDPDHLPVDAMAVDEVTDRIYVGDAGLQTGERYRVIERRIEPGDAVTVAGVARADGAEAEPDSPRDDDPVVTFDRHRGSLRRALGVPYVIGDADGGAPTRLRNRAIIGAIVGLPLVMLSGAYLFAA